MAKINVRSPYFVNVTATNLTKCDIELYIYEGTQTTNRGTVKYTISTAAYNQNVTFEISELVKDYLEVTFNGNYTGKNVWVDYRVKNYINGVAGSFGSYVQLTGFDGYGYFEEGANPQNNSAVLISNDTILLLDDNNVRIPVDSNLATNVSFLNNGEIVYNQSISTSTQSNQQIIYVSNGIDGADSFKDRVLSDSGTFEDSECLKNFLDLYSLFPIDKIYVEDANGVNIINVDVIEECKQTPYKLTFINKFGALQDLWFFKKSNTSLTTKDEKYKSNIVTNGSYNISSHVQTILNKQGSEKLTLNSGFYPESNNEVFSQLFLSEKVWIEVNSKTLPVNISTSSLQFKTRLNDNLINYTIDVDYAFDKINNIR